MLDLAIRDALILDGRGDEGFVGDLGVEDGRIAAIGAVGSAREVHNAGGSVLAPGFVDAHTHDDGALLTHPDMWFKTNQGITTVVIGNCGFSAVGSARSVSTRSTLFLTRGWDELEVFRDDVSQHPPAVNAIALVGHNTIRDAIVGAEPRPATPAELKAMRRAVARAMEQGACGFSTGLLYAPGASAPFEELVALAAEVGPFGGCHASHIRNEFDGLLDSIDEALAIGREARVPTQISHHKAAGSRNWGLVRDSLDRIDDAVARGQDVSLDVYPYTAGSGPMAQYFRDGIDLELAAVMRIASCPDFPEYEGKPLVDLAAAEDVGLEVLVQRILDAPGADRTVCLQFLGDDRDIETNLRHPLVMVGSDGIPQLAGRPHPRLVGTFPRVLGEYVRDRSICRLPEMVRRMTSLPARRFGIPERGLLQVGYHADLVLFDPDRVADAATYDEPLEPSRGIELVIVAGQVVWGRRGATAARPGQVLRRLESSTMGP